MHNEQLAPALCKSYQWPLLLTPFMTNCYIQQVPVVLRFNSSDIMSLPVTLLQGQRRCIACNIFMPLFQESKHGEALTYIFTDGEDDELKKKIVHLISPLLFLLHRWFCHVDDDNYVNVRTLVKHLSLYPHTQDLYIGKPSSSLCTVSCIQTLHGNQLCFCDVYVACKCISNSHRMYSHISEPFASFLFFLLKTVMPLRFMLGFEIFIMRTFFVCQIRSVLVQMTPDKCSEMKILL
ncbi:hypothetical protein XENOCAPTIV_009791 [Xenoophorus captivus]|uniref:Fringe-like glycosyltransferase domain-containing protein n=1 Tax=Xenoophorus captivus TaxID=1517983 RepID=A0ABV0QLM4_9TELE